MTRRASTLSPRPWPWPERPRVLLEHPDRERGLAAATALRQAGYAVGVCQGPLESGRPPARCPLVGPAGCMLVDGADVVVSSLGVERNETCEVIEALRIKYPRTPLIVELPPEAAGRRRDLLGSCDLLEGPAEPEAVVVAVQRALEVRR